MAIHEYADRPDCDSQSIYGTEALEARRRAETQALLAETRALIAKQAALVARAHRGGLGPVGARESSAVGGLVRTRAPEDLITGSMSPMARL